MSSDALKTLQEQLEELTRENNRLKGLVADVNQGDIDSSPTGIDFAGESSFSTPKHFNRKPRVILDFYNKCAKTILDHTHQKDIWRASNYLDDPVVRKRITDKVHYLFYAKQSLARYSNGRMINCLMKMRKFFGEKDEITPEQGREMSILTQRLRKKRGKTEKDDTVKLDPVRTDFTEFIGNVCFNKLVNPLVPKESGKSSQDYDARVTVIAEQIRLIFFGEPQETVFYYTGHTGTTLEIELPSLKELKGEVRAKLYQKENQEGKYIRKYFKEYEDYMSPNNLNRTEEEDEMHQNSKPVIEQYQREKMIEGVAFNAVDKQHYESTRLDIDFSLVNKSHLTTPAAAGSALDKLYNTHYSLSSKQQRAKLAKKSATVAAEESESETDDPLVAVDISAEVLVSGSDKNVFLSPFAHPRVLSRGAFAATNEQNIKKVNAAKTYKNKFQEDEQDDVQEDDNEETEKDRN